MSEQVRKSRKYPLKRFVFDDTKHDVPGLVSISQIQQFMKCPKSWAFNYIDKITPRVERPYLTIGKLCHVGMAAAWTERWHNQQTDLSTDSSVSHARALMEEKGVLAIRDEYERYLKNNDFHHEEIDDLEALYKEACHIFLGSFRRVDPFKYEVLSVDKETPMVEFHFIVPCPGSKGMHGYIDVVLKEIGTDNIWAIDWKYRSQMSSDAEEPFNLQNAVYNYALHRMGIHVTGSVTWQHTNKAPAIPTMNKNGTMSRSKIRTTWEVYRRELCKNGLDPEEYREEMEEKLSDIQWEKINREYLNDLTLLKTWNEIIVPVSRQIASKRKKITASMFPWNCKICHYSPICLAEIRGYDVDFIKDTAYMPKPKFNDGVSDGNKSVDTDDDVVV